MGASRRHRELRRLVKFLLIHVALVAAAVAASTYTCQLPSAKPPLWR